MRITAVVTGLVLGGALSFVPIRLTDAVILYGLPIPILVLQQGTG